MIRIHCCHDSKTYLFKYSNSTGDARERVTKVKDSFIFEYPCDSISKCEPYVIQFPKGSYEIELWGSSGGSGRENNSPVLCEKSGGNGSYVKGHLHLKTFSKFYLYLGSQGEDQSKTDEYSIPAKGGWNFGGDGGIDKNSTKFKPTSQSGAGGGGSVDLRNEYIDINSAAIDQSILTKSLKSRIMVAGSGGGAVSDTNRNGLPGRKLFASNNGEYMFGGTQTSGELGIGKNGIDSDKNQGGSGGCGSGYRGCYHNFPLDLTTLSAYEYGGSGGSSYISGHPGCISPHYPSTAAADEFTPFHESHFYFTNTLMRSGDESMPDPFHDNSIIGHYGHGVCRIRFLFDPYCQTHFIIFPHYFSFSIYMILFCLVSE
ncbi:hypothetical protein TVAG_291220 [Trichomonas vaginalis G3]|uniref:receptor protein-tyrosine kinase n=1 Tax=Trichomonas vaginalis (strain ATCC PRA-98 / G3) TaxID=412133 RepID=A2G0X3_TRIV3|nr:glycine-rich protein family [Trichomonas vaginalis G3]EAX89197.1 hypothetical protein TVAG_291220 [Trichomonas vaginalis G3]KAI5500057.1 glycine-rich protein family [Trichomonas vaginalis G3]|eukprot:XP_001302127.1 hypothetical protein [Trichomonas vaginalis G3]